MPAAAPALRADGLLGRLIDLVMTSYVGPDLEDNLDPVRFPQGFAGAPLESAPQRLAWYAERAGSFERLWSLLDPQSAETMLRVLAYRVLGHRKLRIMGSASEHAAVAEAVRSTLTQRRGTGHCGGFETDLYDLGPLGYPLQLHAMLLSIMHTFVLEQYRWDGPPAISVQPGDVVVDGGGCVGDTALLFAHLAGPTGRVHVFEFEPSNLLTLKANLALNPAISDRVDVIEHPLWHTSGEQLTFAAHGPGSYLGAGEQVVGTRSVDALVAAGEIERVDFLKLDIEGAELQALEGARDAITRFRPRLAISAYHLDDDLITIPAFIDSLGLGYRYALGHYTLHQEETVLYAWCD